MRFISLKRVSSPMEDSLFIYTPSRLQLNIVLLNCIKYIIKSNIEIIANLEIIAILK